LEHGLGDNSLNKTLDLPEPTRGRRLKATRSNIALTFEEVGGELLGRSRSVLSQTSDYIGK